MFRRLTKNLSNGSPGALFLEFIILVAGILLALGIDEYQQEREDRQAERDYLRALKVDLEYDLKSFDERIFPEIEMRLEKSEQLKQFTRDNVPETLDEQRTFILDINFAGFMNTYQPRRNAMDDLLATGNLKLIRNHELRLDLLDFYNELARWEPYDDWARKLIWEGYRNEFTGFIPLDAVNMSREGRSAAPRESFATIVENEVFQRGLLNVGFMAGWQKGRYEWVYERIGALVASLDEEIARLGDNQENESGK